MELWYPSSVRNPATRDGGVYESGYPYRGVLHTTESLSFTPSTTDYGGWHSSYPHFTAVDRTSEVVIYQHLPIDRASRALANPSGGVQTNRARAIQIEIVGKAAESASMSPRLLHALGSWMRWVEAQTGMRSVAPFEFLGSEAYGTSGAARMSAGEWRSFDGWCGHQHVPENSHWDPGKIRIDQLLAVSPEPEPVAIDRGRNTRYRVVDVAADDVLNVRAAAGVGHDIVGALAPHETTVTGSGARQAVSGTEWVEIAHAGGSGWVSGRYLEKVDVRPELQLSFVVVGVEADDALNMRVAPGIEHPVLGAIPPGASGVEGTGAAVAVGMADWYEVTYGAMTGWCHSRYLSAAGAHTGRERSFLPISDPRAHGYPDDAIC